MSTLASLADHLSRNLPAHPSPRALLEGTFRRFCVVVPVDHSTSIAAWRSGEPHWGLDPGAVAAAVLSRGAGADAIALAVTLRSVLGHLGIDAEVREATPSDPQRPPHAVVLAHLPDASYVCDPAHHHLRPAVVPSRPGSCSTSGPAHAPVVLRTAPGPDAPVVHLEARDALSGDTAHYLLAGTLDDAGCRELHAAAEAHRLVPYIALSSQAALLAAGPGRVVLRGHGAPRTLRTSGPTEMLRALMAHSALAPRAAKNFVDSLEMPVPSGS